MRKSILRATAWLMALLVAVSSLGSITTVSAAEETVLELAADMAEDGIITVNGGSWDKIVVPRTAGAKKILLNGVIAGSLVIESGTDCIVEVSGGKITAAMVTPPQLETIGYEEITKMLEEGMPAEEVAELYRSYLREKESLSKAPPTLATREEADIKAVQVSGNAKLELGKGKVGEVKIDADGAQEFLNVQIAGYGGTVDVEQKELPDGVWNVMKLTLDNSDLAELSIAGAKSSACHVEGWKSNVGKVELAGQTSLTMTVKAEEVRLDSKAENAFLKVYSEVGSIVVEGNKNSVSLAASAKVKRAEIKGDNVKVYGSGQLDEADVTGSGANVSTAWTKVEGENNSTPPAGSTPSYPSTPVRPTVTPTPKPEATPTPKPTGTPEEPEIPETDASLFTYAVNTDGTVTVTGMVAGWADHWDWDTQTVLSIPKLIDGKQVTAVAPNFFIEGFWYTFSMLVFPEGLISIGEYAFNGVSENSGSTVHVDVKLPSTLETIGNGAFQGVPMETVRIPAGVKSIGMGAFAGVKKGIEVEEGNRFYTSVDGVLFNKAKTSLIQVPREVDDSYSIPDTVRGIEAYAFYRSQLSSITIPEGVETIGVSAFYYANQLEHLVIPSTVKLIISGAFNMCSALSSIEVAEGNAYYTSEDGTLYSKDKTVLYRAASKDEAEFVIPESVTEIGYSAFSGCTSLQSITIPESVTEIRRSVFMSCTNLKSITIPEGVTQIGYGAFNGCTSLESITIPESVTQIETWIFSGCNSLTIIAYADSYAAQYAEENNIPLKLIDSEAISPSDIFSFVKGYNGTITITGLKDGAEVSFNPLTIPAQFSYVLVKRIGKEAFAGNEALLGVNITSGIEAIEANAFANCSMLTFVDIPATVMNINTGAFANIGTKATGSGSTPSASASSLAVTVIIRGDDVQISEDAFSGISNALFQVQEGSKVEAFLRKQGFSEIEYLPEE